MLLNNTKHSLDNTDAHFVFRQVSFAFDKMQCASTEAVFLNSNYVNATIASFWRKFNLESIVPKYSSDKFLELAGWE